MHYVIHVFVILSSFLQVLRVNAIDVSFAEPFSSANPHQSPQLLLQSVFQSIDLEEKVVVEDFFTIPTSPPWILPPTCIAERDRDEPFCLFTTHEISSHRGISIITTPSAAEFLVRNSLAFDPTFFSDIDQLQVQSPSITKQNVSGKGIGLFSKNAFERGDYVFSHTPLLLLHEGFFAEVRTDVRQRLTKLAVQQLPRGSREVFWSQMGHFGGDQIDDRIRTNAFGVEIGGNMYHAMFPETAQINHECRPNTMYYFDPETLRHYVHAITSIPEGRELSVSYINVLQRQNERQSQLHRNWGFNCTCNACSLPPPLLKESDSRVDEINAMIKSLSDWSEHSSVDVRDGDWLLELCDKEQLWIGKGLAYRIAAENWNGVGEKRKAVEYARLAIEHGSVLEGDSFGITEDELLDEPNGSLVSEMSMIIKHPERHWTWMKRVEGI